MIISVSGNKALIIYFLPVILFVIVFIVGCDSFDIPAGAVMVPPDPPPPPQDSVGLCSCRNITPAPGNAVSNNKNSPSMPASTDIKYYESEESNTPDFPDSVRTRKLYNSPCAEFYK